MNIPEKYDRTITGILSGFLLPVLIAVVVFVFSKGHPSLSRWLIRISEAGVQTHVISLCVFPNVLIFLFFNQFDMLKAARGVLGTTIAWAILVFIIKFI